MKLLRVVKNDRTGKKWMAVFDTGQSIKEVHFGSFQMEDYTTHKNELRRGWYLKRHKANEDWKDPTTEGALSRWLLWEKTSLREAITAFRQRFSV